MRIDWTRAVAISAQLAVGSANGLLRMAGAIALDWSDDARLVVEADPCGSTANPSKDKRLRKHGLVTRISAGPRLLATEARARSGLSALHRADTRQ
jgi:hypothetical protein